MAESAFSDDGKYFSAISQDGRLKIWDTETNALKQEYTPDLHLSSPPSCLQWIIVSNAAKLQNKVGKRKSSGSEQETHCIALGTANGKIVIYNVAQAKVDTILAEDKNNSIRGNNVTSLDWHRKHGLFSSNKESFVYEWDIQGSSIKNKYNVDVENKNRQTSVISAIKIVPHNQDTSAQFLVTASWQLRLWCLRSGLATLVKSLGHSGGAKAVLTLATPLNKCYVVEGSHNERLLSFWDVTVTKDLIPDSHDDEIVPTKKQRKKSAIDVPNVQNPTYNFILEDAPRVVDIVITEYDGGVRVNLAASTRSGVLHYYSHMLNGASTKPIKPTVTVHTTTRDAKPLPIQCCKFTRYSNDDSSGEMVLGYEATPGRILFERVIPNTKTKTQVLIRADPSTVNNKKNNKLDDANKVKSSNTNPKTVTYVEPMGGVTRKRTAPGTKVEVPMEARLANLALDVAGRSKTPVSQNLTKLLVQGLHSKDKAIIMTVLQKDDPLIAKRTVANLPPDYVPQLLEQLTEMATKKTTQCLSVCTWVSALLRSHSALLLATLSTTATADMVNKLLAILTQRRSHLCQLLNLKGRLELTITQRRPRTEEDNDAAVLNYNDTSSEDEMDIDNQSETGSMDMNNFEESETEGDTESEGD